MRKSIAALALALCVAVDASAVQHVSAAPTSSTLASSYTVTGADIVQTALRYLGYPYTTVGNSPATGFSCIGFVSYVYQSNGIPLPDDLWDAMAYAQPVAFSDLLPGDVLWFQNTVWPGLSHTAIYLGGGRFVHAEWYNRGVVTSTFTGDPVDGDYWTQHYLGASRPWGGVVSNPSPSALVSAMSAADSSSGSTSSSTSSSQSSSPAPSPQPKTIVLDNGPRAHVQVAILNVRRRPSLVAPIAQLATQGTTVVVLKQFHQWDWVQLNDGSYGWVSGLGVGVPGAHPLGESPSSALPLLRIPIAGLRVRQRPGLRSLILAMAYHGDRLLVLKRWNGWLRVLMPDGTRGWVKNLQSIHTWAEARGVRRFAAHHGVRTRRVQALAAQTAVSHRAVTLQVSVRLRARPTLKGGALSLAVPGTHLHVLGTSGNWAYVWLRDGRHGWMYRSYLE